MPRAKLTVTIPGGTWIHDVSTAHPDVSFRVSSLLTGDETGVAVVELRAADPVSILGDVDRSPDVTALDLLWSRGEEALLQVEVADPSLLDPVQRAGVPLETPFEVRDGAVTWELTTTRSRLSALGRQLDDADITYSVERITDVDADPADELLTDRQLELLRAAFDAGYYDAPRTATLTEVAESVGVAKATASDVLHRAEGRLIRQFIEDRPPEPSE